MTTAISGSSASFTPPPARAQSTISDTQRQTISDTLSQFDPENLSEEQAQSIVESFKDAGIQPGKAMAEAMEAEGFDARTVGELADVHAPERQGGRTAPPPPPNTTDMLEHLEELLSEYDGESLTEDNKNSILEAMQERFSLSEGQSLIDLEV